MVTIMVTNHDTKYCVNQMSTIEKSPWAPPRRASGYGTRGVQAISCRASSHLRTTLSQAALNAIVEGSLWGP